MFHFSLFADVILKGSCCTYCVESQHFLSSMFPHGQCAIFYHLNRVGLIETDCVAFLVCFIIGCLHWIMGNGVISKLISMGITESINDNRLQDVSAMYAFIHFVLCICSSRSVPSCHIVALSVYDIELNL